MGAVCLACCNQVHSHVAFNECFLSQRRRLSQQMRQRAHGEEFPVNGTPVVETPSVVTGTPFDFAPL